MNLCLAGGSSAALIACRRGGQWPQAFSVYGMPRSKLQGEAVRYNSTKTVGETTCSTVLCCNMLCRKLQSYATITAAAVALNQRVHYCSSFTVLCCTFTIYASSHAMCSRGLPAHSCKPVRSREVWQPLQRRCSVQHRKPWQEARPEGHCKSIVSKASPSRHSRSC